MTYSALTPRFGAASASALRAGLNEGAVVACSIVWSETHAAFSSDEEFARAMHTLGVEFSPMLEQAATLAGVTWKKYRAAGGKRDRVIADFLIGAHATGQCDRLLTRDRGYYKKYSEAWSSWTRRYDFVRRCGSGRERSRGIFRRR